jgi:hypothetical protein
VTATPDTLASLAARLTEPQDRETYAALISYFDSLPPGDELFRLAQLLGLLSLLGQRIPEALTSFVVEFREQTKAVGDYCGQVDERLARLPQEIAQGVDAGAIAKAMSESFRQQLAATGLHDTAALLNLSATEIKALAASIAAALKPVTQEYKGLSETISAELGKLIAASRQLREHNAGLIVRERSNVGVWQGLLALVLFLAGGLCGIVVERRQTTDILSSVGAQTERIETPSASTIPLKAHSRKAANP